MPFLYLRTFNNKFFRSNSYDFIFKKNVIFPVKSSKVDPLTNLQWLLSEICMHRLLRNKFLLSLRQNRFSIETIKSLGTTPPFLYLKRRDISSQVQQKRPSQTPAVAPFRHTYKLVSKKYVCTEPKTRSVQ